MNNSFSARITALRKERRISQKDAAKQLGISQSLLSHYEKGIRECGLDFLCDAAAFYGVSTDYLLGRTDLQTPAGSSANDDSVLSAQTVCRAGHLLFSSLETCRIEDRALLQLAAFSIYKVMMKAVEIGILPESWSKHKILLGNRASAYVCTHIEEHLSLYEEGSGATTTAAVTEMTAPPALQTLEDTVVKQIEQQAHTLLQDLSVPS